MEKVQLFGGAMEAKLPQNLQDASLIRQIPDNQEVFLSKSTEDSIIIELMEPAPLKEHFEDIIESNESSRVEIIEQSDIIIARLECAKFNQTSQVIISMGNVTQFDCDILVTINSESPQRQLLLDILSSLIVKDPSLFQ